MSLRANLLEGFELHDPEQIRLALRKGASAIQPIDGKLPIEVLIEMYTRSPRFASCLRVLLDAGAILDNAIVKAVLLDDADALRQEVEEQPEALYQPLSLPCAYTSLRGVSPLHVCAEYNSVLCAQVLLDAGLDVNVQAEVGQIGLGGHTPVFHTVNSNQNYGRPMMDLLLDAGAAVDHRVQGLVWGENCAWETVVFDVTPLSYAQCGLYRQFHRREEDIYDNIDRLYRQRFGSPAPRRNVPNRYVAS